MSTSWKQCSVWALRVLYSQGGVLMCRRRGGGAACVRVFTSCNGAAAPTTQKNLGVARPGWFADDPWLRGHSSLAATEVDLDELAQAQAAATEVAAPGDDDGGLTEADREACLGFLKSLGLKGESLKRLVKKYPLLLSSEFREGVVSLVRCMSELGISEQLVPRILEKNPQLILRILERNLYGDNLAYLHSCGLTGKQLERVVRIYPQSLGASKELRLQPMVEFLLGCGVTPEKLGKVLALSPYYLGYRHDVSLQPKVAYLLGVGVKRHNLGKLIMEQPSILCLSIGENIMPKLNYLESVGVERARLGELICRYPAVLTSNLDTLKLKVEFFASKGLVGKNLISLLTLHPDLLGKSLESLESGFVNAQKVGFTQDEVCTILKMHPTILSCTESNLQKKFNFLTTVMNRPLKEVLKFTAFVTYSLERRIKRRHRVFTWLLAEGLLPQKSYSLRTIIGGSEEDFRDRYLMLHPLAEAMYKEPVEAKGG